MLPILLAYTTHILCKPCVEKLRLWTKHKAVMNFGIPMLWREPKNHIDDCYFCIVNVQGFNKKNKHSLKYPNLDSALRPIPHCDETIPIPVFKGLPELEEEETTSSDDTLANETIEEEFRPDNSTLGIPYLFNQMMLNDLIRDLSLSKEDAELLASGLKESNILSPGTRVTFYRKSREIFRKLLVLIVDLYTAMI